MARNSKKSKAEINKQLWEKSDTFHRRRWQSISQKGYDFYLDEQLKIGFKAKPELMRCLKCPLNETCLHKTDVPLIQKVYI